MRAALVSHPLDPAALLREVSRGANGAAILFVGTVREVNEGRPVTGIDYSAYAPMAERELAAIATAAARSHGTDDVVIEHRIGTLALGEASVAIAVAHPHRAEAYEASRWIIEEIKRRVPIWKREHYADGTREWVDPTRPRGGAAVNGVASGGAGAPMRAGAPPRQHDDAEADDEHHPIPAGRDR